MRENFSLTNLTESRVVAVYVETRNTNEMARKISSNDMAGEAIKTLMEFCINEKIHNPKITMDAKTTDGEHYRLVFERLDIDAMLNKDGK